MTPLIRIHPARGLRREFAAWAVAQRPKVRTCGPEAFAVEGDRYVQMPEALLIGATVDGQPYIPVADTLGDPEQPQVEPGSEATGLPAAPTGADLLGVATPEAFTPPATAEAPEPSDSSAPTIPAKPAPHLSCGDCRRQFSSKRGLRAHRRQAHGEGNNHAR